MIRKVVIVAMSLIAAIIAAIGIVIFILTPPDVDSENEPKGIVYGGLIREYDGRGDSDVEGQERFTIIEGNAQPENSANAEVENMESEISAVMWDKFLDRLADDYRYKSPSKTEIDTFKTAFDRMSDKEFHVVEVQNLTSDAAIEFLLAILFDTNEPQEVLESAFNDVKNRNEDLRLDICKRLSRIPGHPLADEAKQMLLER